jgi:hypothetical protein
MLLGLLCCDYLAFSANSPQQSGEPFAQSPKVSSNTTVGKVALQYAVSGKLDATNHASKEIALSWKAG